MIYAKNTQDVPGTINQKKYSDFTHLAPYIQIDQATGQIYLQRPMIDLHVPVIVVRHGQTDGNVRNTLQGQVNGAENQLNLIGRQQAQETAKYLYAELVQYLGHRLPELAGTGKIVILTSPMSRAQDTARSFIEYFFEQTSILLPSIVERNLTEISFGAADGRTFEEIQPEAVRTSVLRYRLLQDATADWGGTGESFLDVVMRAKTLLEGIDAKYCHSDVLVISFSHGIFISALRTVVGEGTLLQGNKMIAFRNKCLGNAEPHWLGRSRELVTNLFTS